MPVELAKPINTDDLINITDKVDVEIYILKEDGVDYLLARVFKDGVYDGVGLRFPDLMSKAFFDKMKDHHIDLAAKQ